MSEVGSGRSLLTMDTDMSYEAVLTAVQQVGNAVSAMTSEMATNREVMTGMRLDMAEMKTRQEQHLELKEFFKELKDEFRKLEDRVDAVEARNNKQDGAMGLAQWIKEFGPWLLAGVAALFAYFTTRSH